MILESDSGGKLAKLSRCGPGTLSKCLPGSLREAGRGVRANRVPNKGGQGGLSRGGTHPGHLFLLQSDGKRQVRVTGGSSATYGAPSGGGKIVLWGNGL